MEEIRTGPYVAVTGPVGAGKSTLTARLSAELGWSALPESADLNPFLAAYYADPSRYSFSAQAWFQLETLAHLHRIGSIPVGHLVERTIDERHEVFIEPLRSAGYLSDEQYDALRVIRQGATLYPSPSLIIALHAPVAVLRERIIRRNRDYERGLDSAWLEEHTANYDNYWARVKTPILYLDSTVTDVRETLALKDLAAQVAKIISVAP